MNNIPSPFLLLQFIFIFFINNVNSQNLSENGIPTQDSITNFQPSLAVVIGMLAIMFSLTFLLLLYAKFCHRASSVHSMTRQIQDGLARSRSSPSGVDKTIIESLPFFRFSSLKGSRQGLECSVCLAKFEEVEILRLLPKCKHAFHINCIDQWLDKHSTCPLCRSKVGADDLSELPCSTSLRFLWDPESGPESSAALELYVEREDDVNSNTSRGGSSRFGVIGSSFRKILSSTKEEELPIQQETIDCDDEDNKVLHKFNHKINVVSDVVLLKNRWSNVSSSDLMFLNSEMLNHVSSSRFSNSLDSKSVEIGRGVISEDQDTMSIKEEMERKAAFESKLREINPAVVVPGLETTSNWTNSKALKSNEKRSMSEIVIHPRFIQDSRRTNDDRELGNVKEERMRKLWLPIARKTVKWFANRERRPQGSNLQA